MRAKFLLLLSVLLILVSCGSDPEPKVQNSAPVVKKTITYAWTTDSNNNYFCTASVLNEGDSERTTATVSGQKAPSYSEDGYVEYKAVFSSSAYATQTKRAPIERVGETGRLVSYQVLATVKPKIQVKQAVVPEIETLVNSVLENTNFLEDIGIDLTTLTNIIDKDDPLNGYDDYLPLLKNLLKKGGRNVSVVKYTYTTRNLKGEPTTASALAFFPQYSTNKSIPIYSAQRTAITGKKDSPTTLAATYFPDGIWSLNDLRNIDDFSQNLAECLYYYMVSQTGFITILADGLGFGVNNEVPVFGLNASGRVFADAIYACKDLAAKLNSKTKFNGKIYLGGYSEGGYISMTTAKQMCLDGEEPNGIACGGGCYSISDKTLNEIKNADINYPSPYFVAMMFQSLDCQYGETYDIFAFENAIRNDVPGINFPDVLYSALDGNHGREEIDDIIRLNLGSLYNGPIYMLSQSFRDNIDSAPIKTVFEEQDAFVGFTPQKCKVHLIHNENDEKLPKANAELAIDYFEQEKVNMNLISKDYFTKVIFIKDSTHVNSAIPGLLKTFSWIYNENY